jgi:hypothetical protein
VRLQQAVVAELAGEPGPFREEPRVVQDQVVFQIAIVVVRPELLAQDGSALETQERRLDARRVVPVVAGGQVESAEQVIVAGGAEDHLDAVGQRLVRRESCPLDKVDEALRPAEELVQGGETPGQDGGPGGGVGPDGAVRPAVVGGAGARAK